MQIQLICIIVTMATRISLATGGYPAGKKLISKSTICTIIFASKVSDWGVLLCNKGVFDDKIKISSNIGGVGLRVSESFLQILPFLLGYGPPKSKQNTQNSVIAQKTYPGKITENFKSLCLTVFEINFFPVRETVKNAVLRKRQVKSGNVYDAENNIFTYNFAVNHYFFTKFSVIVTCSETISNL